jgi:large subunit ribosomal protein L25
MDLKIKATKRKELGRKVKKLREKGLLPGNIYGKKIKSESITVELKDFRSVFKEAGETSIVNISLGGKNRPTLIHNVQTDPITDNPLHVDFLQVDLKQKVTAQIPLEIIGESPAEKQGLGTLVQYTDEIEVEALPTELPEHFEIDASTLEEVDDQVMVKDVKIDKKKVEVKDDEEKVIAKVEPLRKEEEVAPPPEEEVEGEDEEAEGEAKEETEDGEEKGEAKEETEEKKESKT